MTDLFHLFYYYYNFDFIISGPRSFLTRIRRLVKNDALYSQLSAVLTESSRYPTTQRRYRFLLRNHSPLYFQVLSSLHDAFDSLFLQVELPSDWTYWTSEIRSPSHWWSLSSSPWGRWLSITLIQQFSVLKEEKRSSLFVVFRRESYLISRQIVSEEFIFLPLKTVAHYPFLSFTCLSSSRFSSTSWDFRQKRRWWRRWWWWKWRGRRGRKKFLLIVFPTPRPWPTSPSWPRSPTKTCYCTFPCLLLSFSLTW